MFLQWLDCKVKPKWQNLALLTLGGKMFWFYFCVWNSGRRSWLTPSWWTTQFKSLVRKTWANHCFLQKMTTWFVCSIICGDGFQFIAFFTKGKETVIYFLQGLLFLFLMMMNVCSSLRRWQMRHTLQVVVAEESRPFRVLQFRKQGVMPTSNHSTKQRCHRMKSRVKPGLQQKASWTGSLKTWCLYYSCWYDLWASVSFLN